MSPTSEKENFFEQNKDLIKHFARSVAGSDLVRQVAELLSAQKIQVIPIKGIVTQKILFDDPVQKPSEDVDLLIHPKDFIRTKQILKSEGFENKNTSKIPMEMLFLKKSYPSLDVHIQLFGFGRFNMPTEELFERSQKDIKLFGTELLLLSDVDLYAHLLGKLVTDGIALNHPFKWEEFYRAGKKLELNTNETASHLKTCGMGRAAIYVLGFMAKQKNDTFASEVLSKLQSSKWDLKLTTIAIRLIQSKRGSKYLRPLGSHMLNTHLPKAAWSITLAFVHRIRYYLRNAVKRAHH